MNGHEVVVASAGKFTHKAADAGLVVFDAAPGLDSEAGYRHQEELRKKSNTVGHFSFSVMRWLTVSLILQDNGIRI